MNIYRLKYTVTVLPIKQRIDNNVYLVVYGTLQHALVAAINTYPPTRICNIYFISWSANMFGGQRNCDASMLSSCALTDKINSLFIKLLILFISLSS